MESRRKSRKAIGLAVVGCGVIGRIRTKIADRFNGVMDNTQIAIRLADLLGLEGIPAVK